MATVFCSIVLNEAEYIYQNLQQHYDYCDAWLIVEGADRRFPSEVVTAEGLSTDATADLIRSFPDPGRKLQFIQHGWADNKEQLRSVYAAQLPRTTTNVIVFDADEFLTHHHLRTVLDSLRFMPGPGALQIPHIHFWKDPRHIITGGYYDVPHDRIYRWAPGCLYRTNHNHPELPGGTLLQQLHHQRQSRRLTILPSGVAHPDPCWLHYGFVKAASNIAAKNKYYIARGEDTTRPQTTRNRAAWFDDETPDGCTVWDWQGCYPEVLKTT